MQVVVELATEPAEVEAAGGVLPHSTCMRVEMELMGSCTSSGTNFLKN